MTEITIFENNRRADISLANNVIKTVFYKKCNKVIAREEQYTLMPGVSNYSIKDTLKECFFSALKELEKDL